MTSPEPLTLAAGDYVLGLQPRIGGSLGRFTWRGEPLMRSATGPDVLDSAQMPLVPFSNRIARGQFTFAGQEVRLPLNRPEADGLHPLHGYGWLSPWQVAECGADHARLVHDQDGAGDWPWSCRAEQAFRLTPQGLTMTLSLHNTSDRAMPAGLGFHPWFPRRPDTVCHALHRGEWQPRPDNLPDHCLTADAPRDWWQGQPVASRLVDTTYEGRAGDIVIRWPDRDLGLRIAPSDNLPFTVIYVPEGADYFCVEPVSHLTDAVNRGGMAVLAPGETMAVAMTLSVLGEGEGLV